MFQTNYNHFDRIDSTRYEQFDEPPVDYSEDEQDEIEHLRTKHFSSGRSGRSEHNILGKMVKQLPLIQFSQLWFECLVGQGGFGKVYRAKYSGHWVAVKEPIYYDHSLIDTINQAIIDEAKLHFHLSHPNIIQLHGISFKGDKVFLVMEYAQGKSLREVISKRTLTPNVIIKFAIQISSAMEYLHNFQPPWCTGKVLGVLHRDLKSPNILLNEPIHHGDWRNKQLKLTDLGLAQEFTHSTKMSQCGTYAWMAPESITESKFSKSSDVWSFGVVLWELLTGQIPYRDFSGPAIAFGIGNGRLTLPIPTTCPEELKKILQACWNPDPKLRPSFTDIRMQLQKSSFNVLNLEQFRKMKQNWFVEIENIWESLKEKEKELESREVEAKRKEAETKRKEEEVEMMKQVLKQQSEELRRREIEVVSRELNVLLQQQQQVQHEGTKHKRRMSRKKVLASSTKIGYPQNFCHNLTITSSHEDQSVPLLQARALNQTWGPGTKIRPELDMHLFSKSRSSSKSQDLDNRDFDKEVVREDGKPPKAKKKGSFLRRIFRSSKTNLNKLNLKESTENVDNLEEHEYAQIDSVKLREKFALNRTYHGQTKHSERKRLNMYEHFLPRLYFDDHDEGDDQEDSPHHHQQHSRECELQHEAPMYECHKAVDSTAASARTRHGVKCASKESHHQLIDVSHRYQQDYNNNMDSLAHAGEHEPHYVSGFYYQSSSRSNSTQSNSKSNTSMSTSEHLDEELLKEFNRFEQEFQSMHCPSG